MFGESASLILRPILLHWRGKANLWSVILLNLLGLTLLLGFVQNSVAKIEWLVIGLVVFSVLVVPVWQSVGVVRACNRYLRERGDGFLTWLAYATLLVVLLMTASQNVGAVLGLERFTPPAEPVSVAEVLPVSADGTSARISGKIDYGTLAALSRTIEVHPNLKRLELASEGGLIFAARAMTQILEARRMDTHVASVCNSACSLIFAAGTRRTLSEEGRLGFHSYGKLTEHHILMVDPLAEQEKDVAYLGGRGIAEDFLKIVYQAKTSSIWYPDRRELQRAGFLTD